MRDGFSQMESRLDQIYNHVDGFMKLHETLDIEFRRLSNTGVGAGPCSESTQSRSFL